MTSEERTKMPTDIRRDDVQRLIANRAQLVEVLPAEEYNQAHLPGAINLPLKKLNRQSANQLDPTHPVIVYCNDFQ
jgi:rhodanese-related sulfurtransferase